MGAEVNADAIGETRPEAGAAARRAHVLDAVARHRNRLIAYSERLHAHPETAWAEHRAAAWTAELLVEHGFAVETAYLGLPTAVHARRGSGSRRIGLMVEYDALPGLGHACGHNLIAATSVGAGLALAEFTEVEDLTVEIFGTPAEEGGGGKIEMLDRGAFADLDLALMVHPGPVDSAEARPYAVSHSHVEYRGRSAHAAAYPEQGVNANDAFVVAQVALGLLRQQLPSGTRVHGVQTRGGEAPNAIPARTEGRWYVRAETLDQLEDVQRRVERCFEAGAHATESELSMTPESKPYAEFRTDVRALALYVHHAESLGRRFDAPPEHATMNRASTDMGNVSQVVPAIHPYIGLGTYPVSNHQPEFAAHCVGEAAERVVDDGAAALALTALDYVAEGADAADETAGTDG